MPLATGSPASASARTSGANCAIALTGRRIVCSRTWRSTMSPKRSSARVPSARSRVARPSADRRTARRPSRPIQYAPPSSPSRKPWPPMIRVVRSGRTTRHATPVPAAMAIPQPSDNAPAWAVTASSESQTSGASVAAPTSGAQAVGVGRAGRGGGQAEDDALDRVEGGMAPAADGSRRRPHRPRRPQARDTPGTSTTRSWPEWRRRIADWPPSTPSTVVTRLAGPGRPRRPRPRCRR